MSYDVIIVGSGVMGSSTAYHLTLAQSSLKVAVIERDPSFEFASSTLSMANVRIQFSLKENIQISQFALEFLTDFSEAMEVEGEAPEIGFHHEGNLFLVDEAGEAEARKSLKMQREMGCEVEWWSPAKIREVYPLYDTAGIVGGTFGPRDGHLDAYAVVMGFRQKARALGAEMLTGEVVRLLTSQGRTEGVELADGTRLKAPIVINCTGAWATELAATAGVELPILPTQRQVFALDVAIKPEGPLPLTIYPSGLYFRTETGNLILLGKSLAEDRVGFKFGWDRERFTDLLWPELAEAVPAWDRLKIVRGWSGLYAVNTLDGNAILGEWPELPGFYLANGFSGHGLQQGPAVGRYLTELILGQTPSLDLSCFSPDRIPENRPIGESGLV